MKKHLWVFFHFPIHNSVNCDPTNINNTFLEEIYEAKHRSKKLLRDKRVNSLL
jgi:hypothetical protein